MATPELSRAAKSEIERIAIEVCGFETLETRKSDRLDFQEISVWMLEAALTAAYLAGMVDHNRLTDHQSKPQ